jgi:hypothetical protein
VNLGKVGLCTPTQPFTLALTITGAAPVVLTAPPPLPPPAAAASAAGRA